MTYSQYDEEAHILRACEGQVGRFLDLGAHDGQQNSNTRALYERGWGGVCVECEATSFAVLRDRYAGEPRVTCVNVAVTPHTTGPVTLYSHGGQVATLVEEHRRRWAARGFDYTPVQVPGVSVADLLTTYPGPYEFVTIDCEGLSFDLAREIDFTALGCRVVCVEIDAEPTELLAYLATHGLTRVLYRSDNLLVGRA